MGLFNTSAESEDRILTRVGLLIVLCVVIATAAYFVVNSFQRTPQDVITVAIDTPYVGQGVAAGTAVIMHGLKVGQVESVTSIPGGGVRLQTDLQREPTRGLTDAMQVDFRPANYFGVTGINVIPAKDGHSLESGMQLKMTPKGDYSLQTLLYRFGELSNGVFNARMVRVIDRATRYADGLNPLLETILVVGDSVAKVQTVSTERLLRNATGVSVAFPGFVDALIGTGNDYLNNPFVKRVDPEIVKTKYMKIYATLSPAEQKLLDDNLRLFNSTYGSEDWYEKQMTPAFLGAVTDLFGRVGYLLGSHTEELSPLVESVRTLTDTVPHIVSPEKFAYTLTELRTRLERMYAGSGEQRALQVRILLDRVPGVAAPMGVMLGGAAP